MKSQFAPSQQSLHLNYLCFCCLNQDLCFRPWTWNHMYERSNYIWDFGCSTAWVEEPLILICNNCWGNRKPYKTPTVKLQNQGNNSILWRSPPNSSCHVKWLWNHFNAGTYAVLISNTKDFVSSIHESHFKIAGKELCKWVRTTSLKFLQEMPSSWKWYKAYF